MRQKPAAAIRYYKENVNRLFRCCWLDRVEYLETGKVEKMSDHFESLKLENSVCFPLYACSKEIVKRYKPYLDELDLTYTQYITMLVMWEHGELSVKTIGEFLYLDSGTLTPVLKTLEKKGYITRCRSREDERILIASVTEEGQRLRERAVEIPARVNADVDMTAEETRELYRLLYKVLGRL